MKLSLLFLSLSLLLSACSTSASADSALATTVIATPQIISTVKALPTKEAEKKDSDNIQLLVGGIPQPFVQGTILPVVGNVVGSLTLHPTQVVFVRSFDLFLSKGESNTPVPDADVQVRGQMPNMAHDDFHLLAVPLGDGHYSVELPCGMNGQWEFDIDVTIREEKGSIKLLVEIFE